MLNEIALGIFFGLLIELVAIVVSSLARNNRQRIVIMSVATLLAGVVGFGPQWLRRSSATSAGAGATGQTLTPTPAVRATGRIAFVSDRDGAPEIYLMKADGSEQTRINSPPGVDEAPVWLPDGMRMAFFPDLGNNLEVYVANADGTGQINLTNNMADDAAPSWSPDGRRIAFSSNRDGNLEIYVMNADGSAPTRLTDNPARDRRPAW